jgi:hypothetical protein
VASSNPFPLLPPKSTELRLAHFDEYVYTADSTTILYKYVDALCGDAGAGSLKKEAFIQRLSTAMSGIYGTDLDYIFGNMSFLSRAPSESYTYNPMSDMLTSDQWDEVRVKDAWYRARITEFFVACGLGSQTDAVRHIVHAACSVDCEIFEVWRYMDNFGLTDNLGRAPVNARNEVVVRPMKTALEPVERRLLREMLDRVMPIDAIMTIDTQGLSVSSPVPARSIAADSTYYEVQKVVTGTPVLASLPAPELLAIDLDPTETWLISDSPELAPYAQFNISSEYGYYYLVSGGARSPIDSVGYGTLQPDGVSVRTEAPFVLFETISQYTDWQPYELADSPDNYPGGKFGIHPSSAPALNPDQSAYQFSYASQQAYVDVKKAEVQTAGGQADDLRYRLPVQKPADSKRTYTADLAIAYTAPSRDSSVTSSWTSRRQITTSDNLRSTSAFVRS